jgi:hypothetical protein
MATREEGGIVGGDSRIRKTRGRAAQRGDAAIAQSADRVDSAAGTIMTSSERRRMIREEWQQNALPVPPDIPGFHVCWLTTNSSVDSIHRRLKAGYTLVRKDELVGFEAESVQNGANQYADYVCCNEMVLGKIPMEVYQAAIEEFHHYGPQQEEAAIRSRMQQQAEELNREAGVAAVKTIGGGFDTLGVTTNQPPIFRG